MSEDDTEPMAPSAGSEDAESGLVARRSLDATALFGDVRSDKAAAAAALRSCVTSLGELATFRHHWSTPLPGEEVRCDLLAPVATDALLGKVKLVATLFRHRNSGTDPVISAKDAGLARFLADRHGRGSYVTLPWSYAKECVPDSEAVAGLRLGTVPCLLDRVAGTVIVCGSVAIEGVFALAADCGAAGVAFLTDVEVPLDVRAVRAWDGRHWAKTDALLDAAGDITGAWLRQGASTVYQPAFEPGCASDESFRFLLVDGPANAVAAGLAVELRFADAAALKRAYERYRTAMARRIEEARREAYERLTGTVRRGRDRRRTP